MKYRAVLAQLCDRHTCQSGSGIMIAQADREGRENP